MLVDKATFLMMTGALASLGCDNLGRMSAPAPAAAPAAAAAPSATAPAGPIPVDVLEAPVMAGASACDDSQGTPEACPSVGPSDEGICPDVLAKRCNEFKAAMKPRVAVQAVACLRALKGNERCDLVRINQCGHTALMSACPEPPRPKKGQYQAASGNQPGSVTLSADTTPDPSPAAAACGTILRSCGEKSGGPSLAECRLSVAGMNDLGRATFVDCVSTHCTDRGLYLCEAVPKAPAAVNN